MFLYSRKELGSWPQLVAFLLIVTNILWLYLVLGSQSIEWFLVFTVPAMLINLCVLCFIAYEKGKNRGVMIGHGMPKRTHEIEPGRIYRTVNHLSRCTLNGTSAHWTIVNDGTSDHLIMSDKEVPTFFVVEDGDLIDASDDILKHPSKVSRISRGTTGLVA